MTDAPLSPVGREDERCDAALTEARAVAGEMHAAGKRPFDIAMAVLPILAGAGVVTLTAQDIVRELPDLAEYSVLDDYQRRMKRVESRYGDTLADLDGPTPEVIPAPDASEVRRRRRGKRFAEQARRYEPELKPVIVDMVAPEMGEIAAEVVQAALARERGVRRV